MKLSIHTEGLVRRFRGDHGVSDLGLAVPAGSIYGFLGPNGAGKTTTIRLLLGLLRPDAGRIELHGLPLGRDPRALAQVGALVEAPSLYPHLSGRHNLEVTRRLIAAPATRIDEVLGIVGLRAHASRRVREYSLGMRQRLAIALALLGRPKLLILDEPANGLDPAGIHDMRRLLRQLAGDHGITVFVSSHQLSEVEQVAHHVGVLHRGRLRFQGSIDELRARHRPALWLRCDDLPRAAALLSQAGEEVEHGDHDPSALCVRLGRRSEAELNRLLVEAGLAVSHLAREQPTLEALFLNMTALHTTAPDMTVSGMPTDAEVAA